jgi:LacI family transcriptional regulator
VTIDRPLPGCASVLTNNFEAAVSATNHLIEHGYRRILCFGAEVSAKLALSVNLSGPHGADAIFTLKNSATIAHSQALQKLRVSVEDASFNDAVE